MRLDTGFRPSKDGFGFANTWRDALLGAFASRGRCGGMVFAALDAFAAGRPLPPGAASSDLPLHGAPLSQVIWKRQVDSVLGGLGENLLQFVRFTYMPSGSPPGIASATRCELVTLFDALRSGRPVPLGLVSAIGPTRLAANHQVLAYAAEFGESRVEIWVYDPNHPRRDDIVIAVPFALAEPVVERIGSKRILWRGLFVERYSPKQALTSAEPWAVGAGTP